MGIPPKPPIKLHNWLKRQKKINETLKKVLSMSAIEFEITKDKIKEDLYG